MGLGYLTSQRNLSLEALRGVAAIVVVIWHSLLDFHPTWATFTGSPLYVFIYGTAAVSIFFALSGYVLSSAFISKRDNTILLRGAIKRWPRLAGPVVVSCLFTWFLYRLGLLQMVAASELSGSSHLKDQLIGGMSAEQISFFDATRVGLTTFFTGDRNYNNPIWTMNIESIGSFVVFGVLYLIGKAHFHRTATLLIAVIAIVATYMFDPWLCLFPAGLLVNLLLTNAERPNIIGSVLFGVLGLYLLGYAKPPIGAYAWLQYFDRSAFYIVQAIGACCLIASVELAPRITHPIAAAIASYLGKLSFPLYLLHVPVICSLGSAVLISTQSSVLAIASTLIGSVAIASATIPLNQKWLALVDAMTKRVVTMVVKDHSGAKTTPGSAPIA